jgi:hypothetical protein
MYFSHAETAIQLHWDWGWTMQNIVIENCGTGVTIVGGAGGVSIPAPCTHQSWVLTMWVAVQYWAGRRLARSDRYDCHECESWNQDLPVR